MNGRDTRSQWMPNENGKAITTTAALEAPGDARRDGTAPRRAARRPTRALARRSIATRRARQRVLSRAACWQRYSGVALTVLAALITELAFPTALRISHPTSLLLVAVVYTIATGRLLAGMTSAAIAITYELYFAVAHSSAMRYTVGSMLMLIVVVPATALITMALRARAETARNEHERLVRAQAREHAHAQTLESANERMDEFLGLASHELRSPLASMKLAIQLAERKLGRARHEPAARHEMDAAITSAEVFLATADAQIARLDRLVRDLLDVSRIRSGKLEIAPEPRDLTALVREVAEDYALMAPERELVVELAAEPLLVSADHDRMREVLENFLNNALRYAPPARPITITLAGAADTVTCAVRDEGPGLTAEARERIWERFQRATHGADRGAVKGAGEATGGGGLGLGLYLSREIITLHGGSIGVESVPGKGSTFWFRLPRLPRDERAAEPCSTLPRHSGGAA